MRSSDCLLVSGSKRNENTTLMTVINPKTTMITMGKPNESIMVRNVKASSKLVNQLKMEANDTAGPLAQVGYISELIIQGSDTVPEAADATNRNMATSENIAYLLSGQ